MPRQSIGRELLDVPMGEMIRSMAFAIADAQIKLDSNSIEVAQMMGGLKTVTETINGNEIVTFQDSRVFFGKEKITLINAIELYNTTNDIELKVRMRGQLTEGVDWEYDVTKVVNKGANTLITSFVMSDTTGKSPDTIYEGKESQGGPLCYFLFTGPDTQSVPAPTFRKVTIYDKKINKKGPDKTFYIPSRLSMLELGFSPTFYQFVDTIVEVKISISFKEERSTDVNVKSNTVSHGFSASWGKGNLDLNRSVTTTQVNANYASKYSYSAEGSSLLRTKLVPIPPPAILDERIRDLMEIARQGEN